MSRLNRDWVAGAMLVLVGLLLLGNRLFPDLVPLVPLVVGLGLLGVFLVTRAAEALVAGGVTTGIGVGVLVATRGSPDFGAAGFLISLAGGFFLVWVLGLLFEIRSVRWWPVVPGSLVLAAGALVYGAGLGKPLRDLAIDWWPLILIGFGAYLLLGARIRARLTPDDETSEVPVATRPGAAVPPVRPGTAPPAGASGPPPVAPGAGMTIPPGPPGSHNPLQLRGGPIGGDAPGSIERL